MIACDESREGGVIPVEDLDGPLNLYGPETLKVSSIPVQSGSSRGATPRAPKVWQVKNAHYWPKHVLMGVDTFTFSETGDRRTRIAVAAETATPHKIVWYNVTDDEGNVVPEKDVVMNPTSFVKTTSLDYDGASCVIDTLLLECNPRLEGGFRLVDVFRDAVVETGALPKKVEVLSATSYWHRYKPELAGEEVREVPAFVVLGSDARVYRISPLGVDMIKDVSLFEQRPVFVDVFHPNSAPAAIVSVALERTVYMFDEQTSKPVFEYPLRVGEDEEVASTSGGLSFPVKKRFQRKLVKRLREEFEKKQADGVIELTEKFSDHICLDSKKEQVIVRDPVIKVKVEAICLDPESEWLAVALTNRVYLHPMSDPSKFINLEVCDTVALYFTDGLLAAVHQTGEINVFDLRTQRCSTANAYPGPLFFGPFPCRSTFLLPSGDVCVFSYHGQVSVLCKRVKKVYKSGEVIEFQSSAYAPPSPLPAPSHDE